MTSKPTYGELELRIKELEKETIERKQAEEALKISEERYKHVFGRIPTSIIMVNNEGKIEDINPFHVNEIGKGLTTKEDYVGNILMEMHPIRNAGLSEKIKRVLEGKSLDLKEVYFPTTTGGTDGFFNVKGEPIIGPEGEVIGAVIMHEDITDKKQAEEELKASEENYWAIFESVNDAIMIHEAKTGRPLGINPKMEELLGYSEEEVKHMKVSDWTVGDPATMQKEAMRRIKNAALGNPQLFEWHAKRKDNKLIWLEVNLKNAIIGGNKCVLSVVRDITEHKRTEAALQESEQKYLSLLEANPDPVVVYDMEGKVIYFNPAFTRVFGWSLKERIGQKMDGFVPEENWPETRMMIKKVTESEQRFSDLETCRYTKEGKIIPVSISGSFYEDQEGQMAGSVINIRDISERKKLEAQIQQTEKMEAIGTLAGGIAHDFNNILSAIIGFTELAISDAEKESTLYQNLKEVFRAGERAKDLVKQILTFSRQAEQERKPVQVKLIIKEAIKFLRASLPMTIDIRQEIKSDSLVMADPTQLHQLIMNLCANAGHAMKDKGGVLEVKLIDVKFDADLTAKSPELKPGPYLELTVSDSGHGIPAHILDRIFDPFFTTKGKSEGTGMGLSVVHGIVGRCGGKITISSEPGKGSTFKICLPTVERYEASLPIEREPIATGTDRILFVDDETAIVNIGEQMLESLGYKVTTRTSSIEALELFKAKAENFDLVITDLTMPNMTGDELAKELIRIRPGIPTILCTGYSTRINPQHAATMGIRAFVSKPVLKRDIAKTIRNVLGEK